MLPAFASQTDPISLLEALVLGIVQGITEFLPISSTAHLRIVPALCNWRDPGAAFTAVIQIGTLAAVLIYFLRDVLHIAQSMIVPPTRRNEKQVESARLGWLIVIGTVPIVVCGLLFKKRIEHEWRSLWIICGAMAAVALVLAVAELLIRRRSLAGGRGDAIAEHPKHLPDLGWKDGVVVGLAQAVALVPGTSRSGATIAGGLFCGMTRETAARFSFLLSLPAVFAAGVFELYKERAALLGSRQDTIALVVATVVSGVVGYASIALLLRYLKTHSTWVFIVYRLLLAGLLAALLVSGKIAPNEGAERDKEKIAARPLTPIAAATTVLRGTVAPGG